MFAGNQVAVKVIREGHEKSFTVKLAELPGPVGKRTITKITVRTIQTPTRSMA